MTVTPSTQRLKILFFMRSPTNTRNLESVVRLLAERGHAIHVAFDSHKAGQADQLAQIRSLAREHPAITYGDAPDLAGERWFELATRLRYLVDYLRYFAPEFRDADKLRERVEVHVPGPVRRLVAVAARRPRSLRVLRRAVTGVERALPVAARVRSYVGEQRADVVAVTPLIHFTTPQVEYVRAAKELRIPTVLCVHSWDNLTNKGVIHEPTELVAVWNAAQREEAVALHGVAPESVVVTGASSYDHWFGWSPSTSREEFCSRLGLDPRQPILLYLCSSSFIAPDEERFVDTWLRALRASGEPGLAQANVVIRPHPVAADPWRAWDRSAAEGVCVWPPAGADPTGPATKAEYYDSIYHASAVVGVNTSALIESAIIGRPVHIVPAPEYRGTQEGTLHFRHLLPAGGGPVVTAAGFADHFAGLGAEIVSGNGGGAQRVRDFVGTFIRPLGIDRSATQALAAVIERGAEVPAGGRRVRPLLARALRLLLLPAAVWFGDVRPRLPAARPRRRGAAGAPR